MYPTQQRLSMEAHKSWPDAAALSLPRQVTFACLTLPSHPPAPSFDPAPRFPHPPTVPCSKSARGIDLLNQLPRIVSGYLHTRPHHPQRFPPPHTCHLAYLSPSPPKKTSPFFSPFLPVPSTPSPLVYPPKTTANFPPFPTVSPSLPLSASISFLKIAPPPFLHSCLQLDFP